MRRPLTSRTATYFNEKQDWPRARRLLVEGDSWFSYPQVRGGNLKSWLRAAVPPRSVVILNLAEPGATLIGTIFAEPDPDEDSASRRRTLQRSRDLFLDWLNRGEFHGVLFSGGGNDLLGSGLPALLDTAGSGADTDWSGFADPPPETLRAYLRPRAILGAMERIDAGYEQLRAWHADSNTEARIFIHGYAHVVPDGRGFRLLWFKGKGWIRKHLLAIPEALHQDLVSWMVDEFNHHQQMRADQHPENFVYVDCRPAMTVREGETYRDLWIDEIHAEPKGWRRMIDEAWLPKLREHGVLS